MLKRTLLFTSPVILSLKNAQLIVAFKEMPEEKRTIPIEDIGYVIIDHPMVTLTVPLINALSDNNVALIFCDERCMPNAMLMNLETNTLQGEILNAQFAAGEVLKKNLWQQIVEAKIKNQAYLLTKLGKEGAALHPYYANVKSGDTDNREGAAARLYWPLLFGPDFVRERTAPGINTLLNYGYTLLRAAVARALMGAGLLPAIGIFHHHRRNAFPLADDVMEPYRPFVDEVVYALWQEGIYNLTKETKARLLNVLVCDTKFPRCTRPLSLALAMTAASLAKCYGKEVKQLSIPTLT